MIDANLTGAACVHAMKAASEVEVRHAADVGQAAKVAHAADAAFSHAFVSQLICTSGVRAVDESGDGTQPPPGLGRGCVLAAVAAYLVVLGFDSECVPG